MYKGVKVITLHPRVKIKVLSLRSELIKANEGGFPFYILNTLYIPPLLFGYSGDAVYDFCSVHRFLILA
jgi:hypothetical protein